MRLHTASLLLLACGCASTTPASVEADQLARSIDALRAQLGRQDEKLEAMQGRLDVLAAATSRERSTARDTRELEVVRLAPGHVDPREPVVEEEEPVMLEITGEGDHLQVVKMPPVPRRGATKASPAAKPVATAPAKADNLDGPFAEALQAYKDGRSDDAFRLFADLVKKNPKSDKAPAALYWMGEARFDAQRYSEAVEQYQRLVDNYPTSNKSAEAMLKIGIAYEKLHDVTRARDAFQRLVDQHPQSAVAELARGRPGVREGRAK